VLIDDSHRDRGGTLTSAAELLKKKSGWEECASKHVQAGDDLVALPFLVDLIADRRDVLPKVSNCGISNRTKTVHACAAAVKGL